MREWLRSNYSCHSTKSTRRFEKWLSKTCLEIGISVLKNPQVKDTLRAFPPSVLCDPQVVGELEDGPDDAGPLAEATYHFFFFETHWCSKCGPEIGASLGTFVTAP